ncbi:MULTISPECIES: hypothetical protein [Chryseobacterium]|nr:MULTISPECIES: hypothetical protein [Chryseobacterium]
MRSETLAQSQETLRSGGLMDMKDFMKLQKDDRLKPADPHPESKTF